MRRTSDTTYRILMNGVTGRMGYRQHLLRSILAIRDDGGIPLPDGTRLQVEPVLLGRNADKLARLADQHGIADWTTDLDTALAEDPAPIYFDAQVTSERKKAILKAAAAGKHVYTEKPIAETVERGPASCVDAAERHGIINGVVHDKLYLPGPDEAQAPHRRRLLRPDPVGARRVRLLGVRGRLAAGPAAELELPRRGRRRHRPRHVLPLELRAGEPLRRGRGGHRQGGHPHPRALGRARRARTTPPPTTRRTRSSSSPAASSPRSTRRWAVRVDREELVEFQVDGTHGSRRRRPASTAASSTASATPMPVWNPDLPTTEDFRDQWREVPDNAGFGNGFRAQWEQFLLDVHAGRRTATTSPPACAGCGSSTPACSPRPRAVGSSSEPR